MKKCLYPRGQVFDRPGWIDLVGNPKGRFIMRRFLLMLFGFIQTSTTHRMMPTQVVANPKGDFKWLDKFFLFLFRRYLHVFFLH